MAIAINRAVEMRCKSVAALLFNHNRTYIWIAGSFVWGAVYFVLMLTVSSFVYQSHIGFWKLTTIGPHQSFKIGVIAIGINDFATPAVVIVCHTYVIVNLCTQSRKGDS